MRRRKQQEEHENHERWLVSYADFITLLFAFFVVMYAISSVNEGKYRTLSHSLMAAFQTPARSLEPIQVGELARTALQPPLAIAETPRAMPLPELPVMESPEGGSAGERDSLARMGDQVVAEMRELIEDGIVTVRRSELWLEVELNTNVLFLSGSDVLSPQSREILERMAQILRRFPNPIRVEGFTDNVPINTRAHTSNWELSAARAASVVRLFADLGVDPARMAAVGFGEYRPIADNETVEGRRKNRRVALVVLAGQDSRHLMDVVREQSEIRIHAAPAQEVPQ